MEMTIAAGKQRAAQLAAHALEVLPRFVFSLALGCLV